MPKVFLSYRRDDTKVLIGRVYDRLEDEFDAANVYCDLYDTSAGTLRVELERRLSVADVVIAVIGPGWQRDIGRTAGSILTPSGLAAPSTVATKTDFVRVELEAALKYGVQILPALVDGQPMPAANELPESLAKLADEKGATLRSYGPDFDRDMETIVEQVKQLARRHRVVAGCCTRCGKRGDSAICAGTPAAKQARPADIERPAATGMSAARSIPRRLDPPLLTVASSASGAQLTWYASGRQIELQWRYREHPEWQTLGRSATGYYHHPFLLGSLNRFAPTRCYRARTIGIPGVEDDSDWCSEVCG